MRIYDLLTRDYTLAILVKLCKNGCISNCGSIIRDIEIFEKFETMLGTAQERYKLLSGTFKLSPSMIEKIILNMKKPVI